MKKTIEERAKEYAGKTGFREGGYYWQRRFDAYIEGATEQEHISYLQGRNDTLAEMAEVIEQNKKEMIDKAWQLMVDWVFENAPHEVFDELMSSREEYVKAMEE